MATELFTAPRRFAKIALALLLFNVCLCQGVRAGASSSVVATGSISAVASHPTDWGQVWQTAISSKGDLVIDDFEKGALYEFPAGGGPMITLAAPGSSGPGGAWANMGVAIDPWDNLWIGQNWNSDLMRIPYDSVNHTWNLTDPGNIVYTWANLGTNPNWFQAGALAISSYAPSGTATLVVSAENVPGIYSYTIDASGVVTNGATVITGLTGRAKSLAIDLTGNIYLVEDHGTTVLRIPAGITGLTDDTSLTRVDPNLSSSMGVTVDVDGNVFVSDSSTGVYFVPNESGTPNPSHAFLMAGIPAYANVDIDLVSGIMYVPTKQGENGGWTSPSGAVFYDVVAVSLSGVNFGSGATYVQGGAATIDFGFAASVTPASFEIVEAGAASADFVIVSGGTCVAGTTYAAGTSCTVKVAMISHTLGNVSATLNMLDGDGNVLASISLSGIGLLPAVVTGPPTSLPTHPATWGQVWNTAISSKGDLVIDDFEQAALYEFPANGGPMITLAAPGSSGPGGGWSNMGLAIDPWDNLWIGQNWNSDLMRIPYDSVNHTWNLSNPGNIIYTSGTLGATPNWFQAGALAISSNVTNGTTTMVVSAENAAAIYSYTIDSSGNFTNGATVISNLAGRAKSMAIDNAGNIYFIEDHGTSVLRIPAGATNLATDEGLTRVDPNLASPGGVAVDAKGNVYVGDNNDGVYLVPIENGVPNPSDAYLLTSVPAFANIDIDVQRGMMYVPTKPGSWGGWNGINDVAAVALANVNLGSAAAGTQAASSSVSFGFSAGVVPDNITIVEAGSRTPDFTIASGGTCTTGTAMAAQSTCSVSVALSPHSAGGVSGKLLMLDAGNNILASMTLYGIGQAGAISVTPALESSIGANLITPGEVAADAAGNSYVADAGLRQVLMYPAGATATTAAFSVGTGLGAPTGVAVDGAGDVFIADSGNVFEVPNLPSGPNNAGQTTLKTGLGTRLNLAADSMGNLYIADPDNARVVKLGNLGGRFGATSQSETYLTGFTAPTVVAVDGSNNLYVVDSPKLIKVMPDGTQTTLLPSLGAATGLAIDASGSVYVSMSGGTVRIPNESGTLNPGDQVPIAASVASPAGAALDPMGNVYLADSTALNIHLVSPSGAVVVDTPSSLTATSSKVATILNNGNAPLTITGFDSTNPVDYSADPSSNCLGGSALSPLGTCTVSIILNPGPGEEGTLTGQIQIQSNAAHSPAIVYARGVGLPLAPSVSTIRVDSSATVVNVPVTVTVTPESGSGVPTGTVTLSVDGANPTTETLVNGSAQFTLKPIEAGSRTFSVSYSGDRVYGKSTASDSSSIAKGAVQLGIPAPPQYVLSSDGYSPTDGSDSAYVRLGDYKMHVTSEAGNPTGTVTFMVGSTPACDAQPGQPPATVPLDANGQVTFQSRCFQPLNVTTYPPLITSYTVTPTYNGDSNYVTSTGSPITFNVLRNPSVVIAANPTAMTVSAGSTVGTNLMLTSLLGYGSYLEAPAGGAAGSACLLSGAGCNGKRNNYTLPLTLGCNGLPAHATCTFTYPSTPHTCSATVTVNCTPENAVDVHLTAPGMVAVTINTNVAVGTATAKNIQSSPFAFAAMFGLGLIGLTFRKKVGQKGWMLMVVSVMILGGLFAGITACSTTNIAPSTVLRTPAGNYPVTITAQQVGHLQIQNAQGIVDIYGSHDQISLPYTVSLTVQ